MRDENGIGSQFLLLDEAMNPLPLPVGTHAGIDDETSFGGFVPNHIALFLKGVALKSFNFHFLMDVKVMFFDSKNSSVK